MGTTKVDQPHLWTAETPYLYTLRTTLAEKGKTLQTFEHKFGFRELTIDGKVLKLNGKPIKLEGQVSWISPKAEFTPKMIQTKEERVNLVYAVKVSFKNDGSAKIGMPGDVIFK